ncbi:MAG: hypothetical protein LBT47_08380 [Deltaproteobacteria bacterium]|nr:hypothetical protein [Deltaproteobacteria bacterium]
MTFLICLSLLWSPGVAVAIADCCLQGSQSAAAEIIAFSQPQHPSVDHNSAHHFAAPTQNNVASNVPLGHDHGAQPDFDPNSKPFHQSDASFPACGLTVCVNPPQASFHVNHTSSPVLVLSLILSEPALMKISGHFDSVFHPPRA